MGFMKTKRAIVCLGLLCLVQGAVYAANGANLIGLLPESRSMGGVGIGMPINGDTIHKNPAWLSDISGSNFQIGVSTVSLDHDAQVNFVGIADSGLESNQSDFFAIPAISLSQEINDSTVFGLGLFGTSGFGVDYRNIDGFSNMTSFLQSYRLVPAISYKKGNIRAGFSTIISYNGMSLGAQLPDSSGNPTSNIQRGAGYSDSFGLTYQVGLGYETDRFTVGTTYVAPMKVSFERLFDFNTDGTYDDLDLEFPSELGVGFGVNFKPVRIGVDWKYVDWENAEGFQSFNLKSQNVYAIGAEWELIPQKLTLRAGYNYGKSPIRDTSSLSPANGVSEVSTGQFLDSAIAMFTSTALPVSSESTYGIGAGYWFTPQLGLDVAYTYAPEVTVSQTGQTVLSPSQLADPDDWVDVEYTSKVSVSIFSFAVKWLFK